MKDTTDFYKESGEPIRCHTCHSAALANQDLIEVEGELREWKVRCDACGTLLGHRTYQAGKVVWDESYKVGYQYSE